MLGGQGLRVKGLGGGGFDDERRLVAKAVESACRDGLGAKEKLQRPRRLGVGGTRRICRVEDLAERDLLRLGVDDTDKPACCITRHAPLANRKAPIDDKPRRNSADFRQKHCITYLKSVDIRLRKRKRGVFRHRAKRSRANRLVRKVKVPAKGTATVTIVLKRLFVPDTEVETIQGTIRRGVLIGDGKELDGVHLEVSPGVEQVFPHDQVRKLRQLPRN